MKKLSDTKLDVLLRLERGGKLYTGPGRGYWFDRQGKRLHVRQTTMGALMRAGLIFAPSQNAPGGVGFRRFQLTGRGRKALAKWIATSTS